MSEHSRPDPDALLAAVQREEEKSTRAKLKIFFGMAAGVGKTYAMLLAAQELKRRGVNVVVGYPWPRRNRGAAHRADDHSQTENPVPRR